MIPAPIGIDLGATTCVMAMFVDGRPLVVPNAEGERSTPSIVAFAPDGEVLVGEAASRIALTHPHRTFAGVPRHLGSNWTAQVDGRTLTAVDLCVHLATKLLRDAHAYLDPGVPQVVLVAPVWFGTAERLDLIRVFQRAGFLVQRVRNAPTATALTRAWAGDFDVGEHTLMVVDVSGNALDMGLFSIADGVVESRYLRGAPGIGGDAFDALLADWLADRFRATSGVDVARDRTARARLLAGAAQARAELGAANATEVNLPYLGAHPVGRLMNLRERVTRDDFLSLTADLLSLYRTQVASMWAAESGWGQQHVLLVGRASSTPAIRDLVSDVALGRLVTASNPKTIFRVLATAEEPALGAAVEAAVLSGYLKDLLMLETVAHSVGIATKGRILAPVIHRDTTFPTRASSVFTTVEDNQSVVLIEVFEGESEFARHNRFLGQVELPGILPAPKGVPQIEVTFDLDANGVLRVSARDLATGKAQVVVASAAPRLAGVPVPGPASAETDDEPQAFLWLC